MIYTFSEQFIMTIYFIILSIFLAMSFDTINIIFNKIKLLNYILQFISWIIITVISIKYVDKVSNGYIPIHIFLFFIVGYILYSKFMKKYYIKTILKIKENKQYIFLAIFPITLYNYIIKVIKKMVRKNEKNSSINDNNNDDGDVTRMSN